MTHDEIAEFLGVYALDAVSPEEALEIEQHLAECPRCRAEVAAHREVAGVLGNVSSTAPPGLWDRIAEELAIGSAGPLQSGRLDSPPEPPALGEIGHGRLEALEAREQGRPRDEQTEIDWSGETPAAGEEPRGSEAAPAPVIAIGTSRPLHSVGAGKSGPPPGRNGRRYAIFAVAASVVVVLALVVGALATKVRDLDNQVSALNNAVLSGGVSALAVAAANDPHHVTVNLTSARSPWSAQVVALPTGEAFLVPGKMPALQSSQTFQAWAVVSGKFVSLGVIGPSGAEMQLQSSMTAILVNTEPRGGTSQPTTTPFLEAKLPKSL
jgi:hypothetical protein